MIAIVEYGAGNQTSVMRALNHLGIPCIVTADPGVMDQCAGIIFPGVGAAAQAMANLAANGVDAALRRAAARGQPILGICLGCQILLERSEEGPVETLGILPGICRKFPDDLRDEAGDVARIPHMGWNGLNIKKSDPLLAGLPQNAEFYFVHGFYVETKPEMVLATSGHGMEFCAVYGRGNIRATQFHPEKSGRAGLTLLENFNRMCIDQC